jgi:hypothetical protein
MGNMNASGRMSARGSIARPGCGPAARGSSPSSCQPRGAAIRVQHGYPRAQFSRLKARRGPKKAIVAVAASLLTVAYHLLKSGGTYQDLGRDHFEPVERPRIVQRHVRRLKDLGCAVQLAPPAPAA